MVLTKGDDFPLHQTPEPVAYAGTDRNFYDRYFFNGYAPTAADSSPQHSASILISTLRMRTSASFAVTCSIASTPASSWAWSVWHSNAGRSRLK